MQVIILQLSLHLKNKQTKQISGGLNQIGHVHGHLLHGGVVERLNVSKDPFVLFCDEVNGDAFPAKTTSTANSGKGERIFLFAFCCFISTDHHAVCGRECSLPMDVVLSIRRKVVVNNQGNLLHVNTTCLGDWGEKITELIYSDPWTKTTCTGSSSSSRLTNKSVVIRTRLEPDLNSRMMISRSF